MFLWARSPMYHFTLYKGIQKENSEFLPTLYCSASGKYKQMNLKKPQKTTSKSNILVYSVFGCAEVLSSIKLLITNHYFPMSKVFAINDGSTIISLASLQILYLFLRKTSMEALRGCFLVREPQSCKIQPRTPNNSCSLATPVSSSTLSGETVSLIIGYLLSSTIMVLLG